MKNIIYQISIGKSFLPDGLVTYYQPMDGYFSDGYQQDGYFYWKNSQFLLLADSDFQPVLANNPALLDNFINNQKRQQEIRNAEIMQKALENNKSSPAGLNEFLNWNSTQQNNGS